MKRDDELLPDQFREMGPHPRDPPPPTHTVIDANTAGFALL